MVDEDGTISETTMPLDDLLAELEKARRKALALDAKENAKLRRGVRKMLGKALVILQHERDHKRCPTCHGTRVKPLWGNKGPRFKCRTSNCRTEFWPAKASFVSVHGEMKHALSCLKCNSVDTFFRFEGKGRKMYPTIVCKTCDTVHTWSGMV